MKKQMLFVSSYLSNVRGSLCVSEKLANKLSFEGFQISLVSRKKNKIIRLIDILTSLISTDSSILHIDVYSGQAFIITEVASWIGRLLGKKLIFTLHGGALPDFYPKNTGRIRRAFNRADIITTPSRMLQQFFEEKGYKIRYIPNSVELKHFPYNRSSVRPFSLLWVRAFDPIYNPLLAIQILAKVREFYPETTLTMIGPDKGMMKEAKALIKELNLENFVDITGPVANTELHKYYQTHAVFLNTTSYESFGVAVLEAAVCGIPIVSTRVGEIPLLWENGFEMLMTEGFSSSEFCDKVSNLFSDDSLNKKLSMNAKRKAEMYAWEYIKEDWKNIFDQLTTDEKR